jgi:hypothetical protein
MDVKIDLPLGNIGDESEECGDTGKGYSCAAPEYGAGHLSFVICHLGGKT